MLEQVRAEAEAVARPAGAAAKAAAATPARE